MVLEDLEDDEQDVFEDLKTWDADGTFVSPGNVSRDKCHSVNQLKLTMYSFITAPIS